RTPWNRVLLKFHFHVNVTAGIHCQDANVEPSRGACCFGIPGVIGQECAQLSAFLSLGDKKCPPGNCRNGAGLDDFCHVGGSCIDLSKGNAPAECAAESSQKVL